MSQLMRDGSSIGADTMFDIVAAKGSDGLAHALALDAAGRLYVNVSGIVSGALTAAGDSVAIGLAGTALVAEGVFSSNGNNAFISATPLKSIQVLGYEMQAKAGVAGTVTVKFYDDTPAQILGSPEWDLQAREGVVSHAPPGCYKWQGASGKALQVNLSGAQSVMVHVVYTLV